MNSHFLLKYAGRPKRSKAWTLRVDQRAQTKEILDAWEPDVETLRRCYDELDRLHRWLGNRAALIRRLRALGIGSRSQIQRSQRQRAQLLDIGCGQGAMLRAICARLGCDGIGVDLRGASTDSPVRIVRANAVTDSLPRANVAISVVMAHHLDPQALIAMIRNVERSCDALVLLDLVRHPLPLLLFRLFVAPLLCPINAADGETSVRRAYTRRELREIVHTALSGCHRQAIEVQHDVAPLWLRQIVTVRWR